MKALFYAHGKDFTKFRILIADTFEFLNLKCESVDGVVSGRR